MKIAWLDFATLVSILRSVSRLATLTIGHHYPAVQSQKISFEIENNSEIFVTISEVKIKEQQWRCSPTTTSRLEEAILMSGGIYSWPNTSRRNFCVEFRGDFRSDATQPRGRDASRTGWGKKKEIQATDRVAGRSGESETGNAINQIGLRIVKKKQKVAQARLLSMTMKIQQTNGLTNYDARSRANSAPTDRSKGTSCRTIKFK